MFEYSEDLNPPASMNHYLFSFFSESPFLSFLDDIAPKDKHKDNLMTESYFMFRRLKTSCFLVRKAFVSNTKLKPVSK